MIVERDIDNLAKIKWLDKYLIGHNGYIAGGCFKNIFNNEKVKDIDMFFRNEKDFNDALNYFSNCKDSFGENEFFECYSNNNTVAFKDESTKIVIELIKKQFCEPKDLLNQFDFTIVKMALYKEKIKSEDPFSDENDYEITTKIILDDMFFEHLFLKRLVVDGEKILYPVSTFERMIKYISYGYKPCRETRIKIIESLNGIDLNNLNVSNRFYAEGID